MEPQPEQNPGDQANKADRNLRSICYDKNFLTNVIFRIDFAGQLPDVDKALPKELRNLILESFPVPEQKVRQVREISILRTDVKARNMPGSLEWNFHTEDRQRTACVAPECFWIRFKKYDSYDNFRAEAVRIISGIFGAFPDVMIRRTGLRYINDVQLPEGDPVDWRGLINEELIRPYVFREFAKANIVRAMNTMELKTEGHSLRFIYGIFNRNYPSEVKEKGFILDFDAFKDGACSQGEVMPVFDMLQACVQSSFERSIAGGLREIMGVRPQ